MATPSGDNRVRLQSVAFLSCLWILTQIAGLFSPPLLDDVDAIHMEAAKEMALRHDYVTLYVDGIRYLDKPPLPYWLGAFSAQLFGPHDWAIRLTLAITVLILTLLLYDVGRRWFNERAGLYAACAFATAIGPYIFTRFFIPDVMLALWMTLAAEIIQRMFQAIEQRGRATWRQAAAFGVVCTAAVLTKGLIGIVFPVALLVLYATVTKRPRALLRARLGLASIVFLLTALPWHILAAIRNAASGESKGWVWFYFVNEQINRYLNKRIPHDYDKVPLLTFYLLLIVWLLPWGIFLVGAVCRRGQTRNTSRLSDYQLLLLLWAALIVGFFTFSTRQEYYTLPAVPALALLVGAWLAQAETSAEHARWAKRCSGVLFGLGILVALVCGYLAIASPAPRLGAELYEELLKHPEDYRLSFGHLFDLTTTAFGFFRAPLVGVTVSILLTMGLAFWLRLKGRGYGSNLTLAIGMCAVLACVHQGLKIFYPILGSEPLAQAIQRQWQDGDTVILDGEYSNGSSINFYLSQPVYMLDGRVNNLWYGSLYADAPHRFETAATFIPLWQSSRRIYFVTHDLARTEGWIHDHGGEIIAHAGGKYVVLNHS